MGSSFEGFVLDPSKCSKLSMDEKRELVYEVSRSCGAPEMLQSWSRREIVQILCAEMGKERKYTCLPKLKLIEHLLKIVSEKKLEKHTDSMDTESHASLSNTGSSSKRQRKVDNPSRLAIVTDPCQCINSEEDLDNAIHCQNSACRATICPEDAFCKRCSCCICFQYDDNKDPSLWLVCNSESPYQGVSCGLSCHLECALKHENAGISKSGHCMSLDGSFYCISCGKVNDLLGCWRKQLMIAKDARRMDIFCYRLSLGHKLLHGTEKYQKLYEIVDKAVKKLEAEVGTLDGLPIKMARGIVNRLSSGAEIQKLCTSALEALDSILSTAPQSSSGCYIQEASSVSPSMISFINVSSTSLTVVLTSESALSDELVGYHLWHRKANTAEYPAEPTCVLSRPNRRFFVTNLTPSTEYIFKIISVGKTRELGKCEVSFRTSNFEEDIAKSSAVGEGSSERPQFVSPKANCSSVSNPSSEGDESNSTGNCSSYREKTLMPELGKVSDYNHKEISCGDTAAGMCCGTDVTEQEEMLGDSVSALDEERITGEVGSEPNLTIPTESQRDSTNSTNDNQKSNVPNVEKKNQSGAPLLEEISIDDESNAPVGNGNEMQIPLRHIESALPITPSKLENGNDGSGRGGREKSSSGEPPEKRPSKPDEPQAGSSSKKRSLGRCEGACNNDGSLERDYEYCVKVIRWLECEGHIQQSFRVKFLTWFSLRATAQERRVVAVFVDTLIDDPASLAGQLVDTFSEGISSKRPLPGPTGFCSKFWH